MSNGTQQTPILELLERCNAQIGRFVEVEGVVQLAVDPDLSGDSTQPTSQFFKRFGHAVPAEHMGALWEKIVQGHFFVRAYNAISNKIELGEIDSEEERCDYFENYWKRSIGRVIVDEHRIESTYFAKFRVHGDQIRLAFHQAHARPDIGRNVAKGLRNCSLRQRSALMLRYYFDLRQIEECTKIRGEVFGYLGALRGIDSEEAERIVQDTWEEKVEDSNVYHGGSTIPSFEVLLDLMDMEPSHFYEAVSRAKSTVSKTIDEAKRLES